jgi:hypothetical protein
MRDCLELLPELLERDERWSAFGNRSSEGVLELKYPDVLNRPDQAYRTVALVDH